MDTFHSNLHRATHTKRLRLIDEDANDIPWRLGNAARRVRPLVQADEALDFSPFEPLALAVPHSPFALVPPLESGLGLEVAPAVERGFVQPHPYPIALKGVGP